jgi:hypothetical protein
MALMAELIVVSVDISAAKAVLDGLSGPQMAGKLETALHATALLGERTVVGFTPVRTGALRASIHATRTGSLAWKIASPLPYARFVEEGTRAHVIRPHGKFLRFQASGGVVYARRVNHPGTKARRMFEQSVPRIQSELQQAIARVFAA